MLKKHASADFFINWFATEPLWKWAASIWQPVLECQFGFTADGGPLNSVSPHRMTQVTSVNTVAPICCLTVIAATCVATRYPVMRYVGMAIQWVFSNSSARLSVPPSPIVESVLNSPIASEKYDRQANLIGSSRRVSLQQRGFCCETGIGLVDSQSMVLLLTRD